MRYAAIVVVAGCSFAPGNPRSGDSGVVDDDAPEIDARVIDAMIDTAPDASSDTQSASPERRIKLTFHNAARPSNLDGFAVLVKLDSTVINYSAVGALAVDLRFFDGDGTALPYEIEKWNPTGTSYVWVRVPRIDASSDTDFIWLHYGDPALVTDGQNRTAVWSNAVAVYHLAEDPGPGNVDDIKDSSVAARHGTASASLLTTNRVATVIGDGLDLPGNKTGVTATSVTLTNYTYMFWVQGDAAPVTGSGNKQPLSDGDTNFN